MDSEWTRRMGTLHAALREVETEFSGGDVPPEALADFKSAVDDIRLRVWAVLSAANTDEYQVFRDRFRVRRAHEICRTLADDLAANLLVSDMLELPALDAAAADLRRAIAARQGGASPPSGAR